jgi:hypothetical protein
MPRKILLSGKEFGGSHAAWALPFGAVSSQPRQQRRNPRLDNARQVNRIPPIEAVNAKLSLIYAGLAGEAVVWGGLS